MDNRINDVIMYLMKKMGNHVESRSKIIKLMYLIDKESKEKLGRKITNTTYYYHYYGSYSEDIVKSLHYLESEGIISETYSPEEGIFQYTLLDDSIEPELNPKEKKIIDDIVKRYGRLSPVELKNVIYKVLEKEGFEPMDTIL